MDDNEFYKKLNNSLNKNMRYQLMNGIWVPPEEFDTNISTTSNTHAPQMTLDSLKQAIQMLRDSDPLLKSGVQQDWVCVIHPGLVSHIADFYKEHQPTHFVPFNKLDYVLGRRVFIIEDAPTDKVEYMPEKTMRIKYAEHFLRELEWLAKRKEEEDKGDATE